MRVRWGIAWTALPLLALWGLGCGGSVGQAPGTSARDEGRPTIGGGYGDVSSAKAAAEATAMQVDYYGWKAFKLTNGLVTVVAVPEIGGRIMEYKLGSHPFLWTNPDEYGKRYDAPKTRAERVWHNFGGYKVWPAPQSDWGGPPDPLGSTLDGGRWEGKVLSKSGPSVALEMTSPEDATITGLQITRRVTLYAGTTRLQVQETFKNVSQRQVNWSIWGVAQVPGAIQPGSKSSPQANVYFALDDNSRHRDGFYYFMGQDTGQWKKVLGGKILETSYCGKVAKIGADSDAGWIAYVDNLHDFAFVQTFDVTPGADYPDQGSTVEVYTNGTDLPYMEVEVLSPVRKLAPGQDYTFTTNWYCTKLGGPIAKATDAAAVKVYPTAARKGQQVVVTGEIGAFAEGEARLEFTGEGGKKVGESAGVKVSPVSGGLVKITATVPAGALKSLLVLCDARGRKVGNVAEVPLVAGLAKASR